VDVFFVSRQFRALASELRLGTGDCPFVVDSAAEKHISLMHFSGGRDASYVAVSRELGGPGSDDPLSVNIGYRPFVEGTTIIYDATAETMQGKARPFLCRLPGSQRQRVYAVMPFQIEGILMRAGNGRWSVGFVDARGELVEAALPFELRLVNEAGERLSAEYHCTDRGGRFSCDVARASRLIARSLLTGCEQSLTLEAHNDLHD
jgi:hypothetical protein